jgi:hypothetical protein
MLGMWLAFWECPMVLRVSCRYFEQYGVCAQCPTARSPASILASVGFPLLLAAVLGGLVALRAMMARGMMKVSG